MDVLLVGNDQTIRVSGVQDSQSGDYLNDITVEVWLKERDGTPVPGETWPITLQYVADSNGDYLGNIEDGVELVANRKYLVEIRAEAPGDLVGFWHFVRPAKWREP